MIKISMIKYKIIKGMLLAGLLAFAMLYESTMFTEVLLTFQTACFEYSVFSCAGEERLQFLTDVKQYAMEENVSVFSVAREQSGNITRIRIFTDDEEVKKQIRKKSGIKEKIYKAPEYGMTDVAFLPFDELKHDKYRGVNFISYAGNGEDAERLYSRISKTYNVNAPSRTEDSTKFLVVTVWTVCAVLLLFMTVTEISGCQKSVAEEFRNGEPSSVIIRKFMLAETVTGLLSFLPVKGIVSVMYPGQVFPYLGTGIYCASVFLSCIMYSYYAFFRWEKFFTGEKKKTGVVKPVLAAVVFLLAINQFLTSRLNDRLVQNLENTGMGRRWFRKEMDGYTLVVSKASPFSFNGQVDIEYYEIPDSNIYYLLFEAYPNKLGRISYISIGFESTDGSGGAVFMDQHMNYQQPSPENVESTKNARKLIEKHQKYVDEVIRIANEQWGLGIGK